MSHESKPNTRSVTKNNVLLEENNPSKFDTWRNKITYFLKKKNLHKYAEVVSTCCQRNTVALYSETEKQYYTVHKL